MLGLEPVCLELFSWVSEELWWKPGPESYENYDLEETKGS